MRYVRFILVIAGIGVLALGLMDCAGSKLDDQSTNGPGFFDTFVSDDIVKASIAFDMDSVMYYKDLDPEAEVVGNLSLELEDHILTVPVEVRTRGNTRKRMCDFPPLRIQLKKAAVREHGWGDFRNYKLVTHCSDTLGHGELVFRELLVYKLYERLTDMSLRSQLLEMQYIFPEDTITRYAVFLENDQEMCARLELREMDIKREKLTTVHFDHYKRFVLFQYMVGNTDWNMGSGHNTKYVIPHGAESPILIPYDFDYCGLVNAPYARPYETLPIDSVRERLLMYRGSADDDFTAIREEFITLKVDWLNIVESFPLLTDAGRKDVGGFLLDFFAVLESDDWKDHIFPS